MLGASGLASFLLPGKRGAGLVTPGRWRTSGLFEMITTWQTALGVFIGTLPMLGVVVWNLVEVKSIRQELVQIRERLATLEERDRWTHPLVKP